MSKLVSSLAPLQDWCSLYDEDEDNITLRRSLDAGALPLDMCSDSDTEDSDDSADCYQPYSDGDDEPEYISMLTKPQSEC